MVSELAEGDCTQDPTKLALDKARELMQQVPDWQLDENNLQIHCQFKFDNFYQTIAFVNAIAWHANRQDHHPDLQVSYNRCEVRFTTHSVKGLSLNDFVMAARIDAQL